MNTITPTKAPLPEGLTEEQYVKALEFARQTPTVVSVGDHPLPHDLSEDAHEKALAFAKLASKTYDWDDFAVVRIGMTLFSGIDDIVDQDFRTPEYIKIRGEGNDIDWWGGDDRGLDFTLFKHKGTGDVVLAFRGTEPLSVEDWAEDIKQAIGASKQYENAVELAKSLQAKAEQDGHRLLITGHSLGGGLATAAALATGCETICFDGAGVSKTTIEKLLLNVENQSTITNFNVRECFVSDWNKKMDDTTIGSNVPGVPAQKQYGKAFWLESVSDRANFKPLPDWTRTAKKAESILNHAWHVITYQLEHKNFHIEENKVRGRHEDEDEDEPNERPSKKTKTTY